MIHAQPDAYAPANITFDLLPPLPDPEPDRVRRRSRQCGLALEALATWLVAQEAAA